MPYSEEETTALAGLMTKCYTEWHASFVEQTRIPNPFPGQYGCIDFPDPLYHEFYLGDHWARMGWMPEWKSRPVNNMVMPAVENYVTFVTDNQPSPSIMPREESDYWLADIMRSAVDYWWDSEGMQTKVTQAVRASSIVGDAWLYAPFEDSQKCYVLHRECVMVDSECTSENFDPQGGIYEYRATFSSLKDAFPNADWERFQEGWTPTNGNLIERVQTKFKQLFTTSIKTPIRTVSVYELWLKDDGKLEFVEELDDRVLHRRKKKYPNGWRVITMSGGIVLSDEPSKYKHGQFPFTPVFAYTVPGRLRGMGHVQALLNIQIMHNRMNQLLYDASTKKGGGIFLLGAGLELDKAKITNAPVQIHNVRDVNAFRVVEFPDPPRHVFNHLDKLEQMARDAVGQHEISMGVSQPGNKTAHEINAISSSDKTRVRSISRQLAWSLERVLFQVVSNLAQFENGTWFLRIADENGGESTVGFQPTKMLRQVKDGEITQDMVRFDLKIDDSSMLPNSANELMAQSFNLYDRQCLSKLSLLKALKVPNPKQELTLINEELSAAQAQAPPPDVAQDPAVAQQEQQAAPDEGAVPFDDALTPELLAQLEQRAQEEGVSVDDVLAEMGVA